MYIIHILIFRLIYFYKNRSDDRKCLNILNGLKFDNEFTSFIDDCINAEQNIYDNFSGVNLFRDECFNISLKNDIVYINVL